MSVVLRGYLIPLTLTLYHASISRRFLSAMPSYCDLISSRTLVRSSWGWASTSTFTELAVTWPRRAASSYRQDDSHRVRTFKDTKQRGKQKEATGWRQRDRMDHSLSGIIGIVREEMAHSC